jgi:thymidylate kinase
MKGTLITFTGIDGSGKSTLTKMLVERLKNEGIYAEYLWWFSAENSIFRRAIRFISRSRKTEHCEAKKGKLSKSSQVQKLYQFLVLLDYQRQTIFRVWIPLISGKNIICDRYVYDIVTSFAMEFNYSEPGAKKLMAKLLRLSPKPDAAFFVDVPVEVAIKRKSDIPSIEHHEELRKIYRNLIENEMIVLNGTADLEELNNVIWKQVCNHLMQRGDT